MSGPDDSADSGAKLSELLAARRRKLEALREAGVDPFPHLFQGVTPIGDIRAEVGELETGAETPRPPRACARAPPRPATPAPSAPPGTRPPSPPAVSASPGGWRRAGRRARWPS